MLFVTLTSPSSIVSKIGRSSYVDTYNEFDELHYYVIIVKISLAHERKRGSVVQGRK